MKSSCEWSPQLGEPCCKASTAPRFRSSLASSPPHFSLPILSLPSSGSSELASRPVWSQHPGLPRCDYDVSRRLCSWWERPLHTQHHGGLGKQEETISGLVTGSSKHSCWDGTMGRSHTRRSRPDEAAFLAGSAILSLFTPDHVYLYALIVHIPATSPFNNS